MKSLISDRIPTIAKHPFSTADLEILKRWDTPTICNGLELIAPDRPGGRLHRRTGGRGDRKLPRIVGLARTGMIRAKEAPRRPIPRRGDWYDYVAAKDMPTIAVLQDIDDLPGYGAFWGEVRSTCIWRSA